MQGNCFARGPSNIFAGKKKGTMSLSILARSDYWITLLTSSPDPYGLAEELSRGHPFDIEVLATFPTAPWATGLKEEIRDLHMGSGW